VRPAPSLLADEVLETVPDQDCLKGYARQLYKIIQRVLTPFRGPSPAHHDVHGRAEHAVMPLERPAVVVVVVANLGP
jgi:hypothetical protein